MKVFSIILGLCVSGIGICVARSLPSDRNKLPTKQQECENLIGCEWSAGKCSFSCGNIKGKEADEKQCNDASCIYCGGKTTVLDICATTKGKCPPGA